MEGRGRFLRAGAQGERVISAALLEGICDYQLGDDAAAEPLLRLAEARPEHQELPLARFYLGLIALRAGAAPRASALFSLASANPALGALAANFWRAWPARTPGWC